MKIGLSLASFYPRHPEDVVPVAHDLGFDTVELFINTYSELDPKYIRTVSVLCEKYGITVYSVHPFTSALENYMFFSRYDRRVKDSVMLYSKYCDAANYLGAQIINIHGDRGLGLNNPDEYIDCLKPFAELSDKYGVVFSHENVFFNSVNHPEFVKTAVSKLGNGIRFTFDIKQAHKGGSDPYELCDAMKYNLSNFHVNDYDEENLCLLPGRGIVDHHRIFCSLKRAKYKGPAIIEVYSTNYSDVSEILRAREYLEKVDQSSDDV